MVKRQTTTAPGSDSWVPITEDELDPVLREEIAARVWRLQRGESTTTSHEEFMKEIGLEDLLEQE